MADKEKKNKKINWTKAQLYGFWGLVIILATFWGGTVVGTQATLSSQAHEASVKAQAVQDYKAEVSKDQE